MHLRRNKPELDAIKIPSAIDIAWSAGVYEGEGTCRICGKSKNSFMISVAQKEPEILYRLRDWFGGSVRVNRTAKYKGNPYPLHTWDICGDRARVFIALIYKFLGSRRREQVDATMCLEFLRDIAFAELSMEEIKSLLAEYYVHYRKNFTERGNVEIRRKNQRERYNKWRQKYLPPKEQKVISIA